IRLTHVADILGKPSPDLDVSRAMEDGIGYYERLDTLEKDGLAKRVIILDQIRIHDEALLMRAKQYFQAIDRLAHEQQMYDSLAAGALEEKLNEKRAIEANDEDATKPSAKDGET